MIDCKICHKTFKTISRTHLLFNHSLTQAEYKKDFKLRKIFSPETRQILSKIHTGNTYNIGRKWTTGEFKIHSKDQKERWKNPKYRGKVVRGIRKAWKDGNVGEIVSEKLKEKWTDPAYRVEMSEMSKRTWRRRDYRKRHNRMMKKLWKTPSFLRKMEKRKYPQGMNSPLTEEQWKTVVGWLAVSPREFGIEAVHWNPKHARDLILKKWGVHLHENTIGVQFRKRGCRRGPIGPGETSKPSNSRFKFQKWVGPES